MAESTKMLIILSYYNLTAACNDNFVNVYMIAYRVRVYTNAITKSESRFI